MSKKCIAASEQQGCSTPIRLPKDPILVKTIKSLIENEILIPLSESHRRTSELGDLFGALRDIADAALDARGDDLAMTKIMALASIGRSTALDIADFASEADEAMRDTHLPAILAAVGGEA